MPFKSLFRPHTRTCPHDDCRQTFDTVVYQHGVMFCPQCGQSVLDDDKFTLPSQTTWVQYAIIVLKRHRFWYILAFGVWFGLCGLAAWADDNYPPSQGISQGMMLAFLVLPLPLIFLVIKLSKMDKNLERSLRIGKKPLVKGVDKLTDFTAHHPIYGSDDIAPCPICQSQKISPLPKPMLDKSKHAHCQNCHGKLFANPAYPTYNTLGLMVLVLGMIWLPSIITNPLLQVPVLLVFVIACHIWHRYRQFKTDAWLIHSEQKP